MPLNKGYQPVPDGTHVDIIYVGGWVVRDIEAHKRVWEIRGHNFDIRKWQHAVNDKGQPKYPEELPRRQEEGREAA